MSASKYSEKGPPPPTSAARGSSSGTDDDAAQGASVPLGASAGSQALHRKLRGKEVQLFAIGGAISTCKCTASHLSVHARAHLHLYNRPLTR